MKRKIIKINEELCDGCGDCIIGCAEGALKIINGKAKLVRDDFCDGFGDCIGTCHADAITFEERDAEEFNIKAVKDHLLQTGGSEAVKKMKEAHIRHTEAEKKTNDCGCPGLMNFSLKKKPATAAISTSSVVRKMPSELEQWPVQLHLVNPSAPFFKNREMVIVSTCSPVASPNVHAEYIKGRSVVVACPKLDVTDPYVEKLAQIFKETSIPRVIVLRMEVPCCGGITSIAKEALSLSGRDDLVLEEHVMGVRGEMIKN